MRTYESSPLESRGHRTQLHRNPALTLPSPSEGLVLDDALTHGHFRDGDCSAACPGCGEVVERFDEGLPNPLVRFRSDCRGCGATLHRWSAVVVPSILMTPPPKEVLRNRVQSHWERQFKIGVEDDGLPHTREFSKAVQKLADRWGWDWTVSCPLCDRSLSALEKSYLGYHHWVYCEDIGTSICKMCHDFIHGGDRCRQANKQDWRAKQLGLADFRDLAVIRLALRDRLVHEPEYDEDSVAYAERLQTRYNVPLRADRIVKLVSDVRYDDRVMSTINEHGPSADIISSGDFHTHDVGD